MVDLTIDELRDRRHRPRFVTLYALIQRLEVKRTVFSLRALHQCVQTEACASRHAPRPLVAWCSMSNTCMQKRGTLPYGD